MGWYLYEMNGLVGDLASGQGLADLSAWAGTLKLPEFSKFFKLPCAGIRRTQNELAMEVLQWRIHTFALGVRLD